MKEKREAESEGPSGLVRVTHASVAESEINSGWGITTRCPPDCGKYNSIPFFFFQK